MEGEEEPPPSPLFVEGGASAFTSELVPTSRVDVVVEEARGGPSAPAFPPMGAPMGGAAPTLVQPTLFSYNANDLVWARAGTKGNQPFWPVRETSKTFTKSPKT